MAVPDLFSANGRLISGMEELIQELAPRRLRRGLRATIVLPEEDMSWDTERRLREAIDRYCQLRLRQTEAAARERGRETFAALGVGLVLFVVGIGLSSYIGQSDWPALVKSFLADGLFLVIAWVGLWYPLDELVHYRRPLNRERKVLRAIREMEIAMRGEQRPRHEGSS